MTPFDLVVGRLYILSGGEHPDGYLTWHDGHYATMRHVVHDRIFKVKVDDIYREADASDVHKYAALAELSVQCCRPLHVQRYTRVVQQLLGYEPWAP